MAGSNIILKDLVKIINYQWGCSIFNFSITENKNKRINFLKFLLKRKSIHFALERFVVKSYKDVVKLNQIWQIKKISINKNKSLGLNKMKKKKKNYSSTKRNYIERMMNEKVECMKIARKFDKEFWDGEKNMVMADTVIFQEDGVLLQIR